MAHHSTLHVIISQSERSWILAPWRATHGVIKSLAIIQSAVSTGVSLVGGVHIRVQPVRFPIGGHVNVLHNYKKTGPSKILKLPTCHCHHTIDMLVEFSQIRHF